MGPELGPRAELECPKGVRRAVTTSKRSAVGRGREAGIRGRVVMASRAAQSRGVRWRRGPRVPARSCERPDTLGERRWKGWWPSPGGVGPPAAGAQSLCARRFPRASREMKRGRSLVQVEKGQCKADTGSTLNVTFVLF